MTDADRAYARAEEIIAEAKASGAERVSFDEEACRELTRIPPQIADLFEVWQIDLDHTKIADLSPLSTINQLWVLSLDDTLVADLTPLAKMITLRFLSLDDTQVADLEPLVAMTEMRSLWLDSTHVSDLTPLSAMSKMQKLSLSRTQVADLLPLASMTAMQSLWLAETHIANLKPLAAMTEMKTLRLDDTQVADLAPLAAMTTLQTLSLYKTQVAELMPLSAMKMLAAPETDNDGINFRGTPAAAGGRLAEIAVIEDNAERGAALLAYLNGSDKDDRPAIQTIEAALRGPILSEALADIEERPQEAAQFDTATLADGPDKVPDARFAQIVQTLTFAASRLATVETENRLGRDVRASFADYHQFIGMADLNPRVLRFLAGSLRAAFDSPDTVAALDDFDLERVRLFLGEHDGLMAGYFAASLRPPEYDVETDPDRLVREMFPRLSSAKAILAEADRAGLFAPAVSDALEMLHRRADGARKTYLTTDDPEKRDAAIRELRRASLLATAYLGRIKGRLTQWIAKQVAHAKENPATTVVMLGGLYGVAQTVIARLTPVFEQLWHLIGNLPLPF